MKDELVEATISKLNESVSEYQVWTRTYEDDGRIETEFYMAFDTFAAAERARQGLQDKGIEAWIEEITEAESLEESNTKSIKVGEDSIQYSTTQDLCNIIAAMIQAYNSLGGMVSLEELIINNYNKKPTEEKTAEYNIEIEGIEGDKLAWNASYIEYIPVTDEQEALHIIQDILENCEYDNIDLAEFYDEIGQNFHLTETNHINKKVETLDNECTYEGHIYTCMDCGKEFEEMNIFIKDPFDNPLCPFCGSGDVARDDLYESKEVEEPAEPCGGDKTNYVMFYTNSYGTYPNNTIDNIAKYGKEHLKGLNDLSIEEIKNAHIYWGTELAGYHAFYNGDTYILFDDVEKLPEEMKQDAYENCDVYKNNKLQEDSSEESSLKDPDKAKFYKDCEDSGKFSDTQLRGIIWGFEHGLTVEQVAFYARPEFDWEQMSEIEDGFRDGLSLDQIKFYATTKFAYDQMREIKEGFNDGLSLDQIKFYATTKFAWDHMKEIRKGLAHGLTLDQVKVYADPKYNYLQMEEIRTGFEHGLSMEQVKVYADPKYHCSEMREIREGFEHGLSMEQVKVYADHPWHYMEPIRKGLEMGLTIDQIKPYTDTKKYAWYDLSRIIKNLAYKYGLLKDTSAEDDEEEDDWKELTTHVEVIETEEEPPYLSGYCDEELEIDDRNDLSENELWATGWSGTIKNIEKAPFKSFKDIDIVCSDNEKDKEYNLPDIPSKIQKEFVTKVNNYVSKNN